MEGFRILVVDDDERILNFLRTKISAAGYEVITASDGVEALERAKTQAPDLVLLDVLMPQLDGIETLKELRSFSSVPVIVLSAKGTDSDRIKGLKLGADDYIAKPFNPDELLARVEAVRRRATTAQQPGPSETLTLGNITIDFERRALTVAGQPQRLTRIEWLLLSELARNAGRLMLYDDLLTRVWGPEYRDDVQILRTWISRLRRKLESEPASRPVIRTVPKTGYILEVPSD